MQSKFFDPITLYVIFGGLGVILVCAVLRQVEAAQKCVPAWLITGLLGVLVGGGASLLAMHGLGFHWVTQVQQEDRTGGTSGQAQSATGGGTAGMAPMGPMGGGMPGGGGGGGGPQARRDLPTLIGKLDLLIQGIKVNVDGENAAKLAAVLTQLDAEDEMMEEKAKEHLDAINELLSPENKSVLASISLTIRRGGGSGGGGRGGGAAASSGSGGAGPGTAGASGGPGGGGPPAGTPTSVSSGMAGSRAQNSNENPFKQEENAKRLQKLRDYLAGSPESPKLDQKPNE